MTSAPRILIPTRRYERKAMFVQYVGEYHLNALMRWGAVPVMVPSMTGMLNHLEAFVNTAAGLLLTEGKDLHPDRYQAPLDSRPHVHSRDIVRDEIEFQLIRHALGQSWPILGICRGSQILNVACGGTLYTDVHQDRPQPSVPHIDYDDYHGYRHRVDLVADGWLAQLYGETELMLNSYHHQCTRQLADRFEPLGYAEDGVLEAFRDPQAEFLVGLQYHPERLQEQHDGHRELFRRFVTAARRYAERQAMQET